MTKTISTGQAMAVLQRYRAFLIAMGKYEAAQIALTKGIVHSREVRKAMDSKGFLNIPGLNDFWLGAVFKQDPHFEWTGDYHCYTDSSRNIHERTVKVWRLKDRSFVPSCPALFSGLEDEHGQTGFMF